MSERYLLIVLLIIVERRKRILFCFGDIHIHRKRQMIERFDEMFDYTIIKSYSLEKEREEIRVSFIIKEIKSI